MIKINLFLIIELGLSLSTLLLLLLTHSVTDYELGPYPWSRLSIDLAHTLCRGSTLYPHHGTLGLTLPYVWTNGVPTKPTYRHDTLLATPTNTPLGFSPGWPRAYQRHQRPPSWQNGHHRGKMVPNRDKDPYNNNCWLSHGATISS